MGSGALPTARAKDELGVLDSHRLGSLQASVGCFLAFSTFSCKGKGGIGRMAFRLFSASEDSSSTNKPQTLISRGRFRPAKFPQNVCNDRSGVRGAQQLAVAAISPHKPCAHGADRPLAARITGSRRRCGASDRPEEPVLLLVRQRAGERIAGRTPAVAPHAWDAATLPIPMPSTLHSAGHQPQGDPSAPHCLP